VLSAGQLLNSFLLYAVKEGDRIAQLILEQIFTPPVVEVEVRDQMRYENCW
jgi:dUTPase